MVQSTKTLKLWKYVVITIYVSHQTNFFAGIELKKTVISYKRVKLKISAQWQLSSLIIMYFNYVIKVNFEECIMKGVCL